MNALDLIIIMALSYFVYEGAQNGLIGELRGITGWLFSAVISLRFGQWAASQIGSYVPLPEMAVTILGYIAVVLGVRLILEILLRGLRKALHPKTHDTLNKLLGAIIGFTKGAFLVSIFVLAMSVIPLGNQVKLYENQSVLFPHMKKFSQLILGKVTHFVPQTQPQPQPPAMPETPSNTKPSPSPHRANRPANS